MRGKERGEGINPKGRGGWVSGGDGSCVEYTVPCKRVGKYIVFEAGSGLGSFPKSLKKTLKNYLYPDNLVQHEGKN